MMLCATLILLCAGGVSDVSVVLPTSATATGLEITVAEVATVQGTDAELVALVRAASLGYAPAPGYHRVLRADLIEASLRRALPGVSVVVTGAPRCRVTPDIEVISSERIRAQATSALRAALVGADAKATPEGVFPNIEVPRDTTPARIVVPATLGGLYPGIRSVPVQIWVGEKLYRTVHTTFRISIWQRRAVLARNVQVGERLDASMFVQKRVAVGESRTAQALRGDQIGGAVALRAMRVGSIVTERDVHREQIVRRGDKVSVRITKGTIVVSDIGTASADGTMGERVAVTLSTGRELIAVVRGPGFLEVKIR